MSSNPITRSHVQLTVKTTAAIINLVVILILDEVYGAVARWLTVLGESPGPQSTQQAFLTYWSPPGVYWWDWVRCTISSRYLKHDQRMV